MLVSLRKKRPEYIVRIIATVPVRDKLTGEVVAQAKMEQTRSGTIVAHIDMSEVPVEVLLRGFSIDDFTIPEETCARSEG